MSSSRYELFIFYSIKGVEVTFFVSVIRANDDDLLNIFGNFLVCFYGHIEIINQLPSRYPQQKKALAVLQVP